MEAKQTQLESLIVNYFRLRDDVDVRRIGAGAYHVELDSDIARIDFGGRSGRRDKIILVFDPNRAYEYPDSELITPSHPFLDIIRNDLERDPQADPRIADAHVRPQLISPAGELVAPQLIFSEQCLTGDVGVSYRASLLIAYRVIYETDERIEQTVRLCYDAETAQPRHELIPFFDKRLLHDGPPSGEHSLDLQQPHHILEAARREIEGRVKEDLAGLVRELYARFEEEQRRIDEHFAAQLSTLPARDTVARARLQSEQEKELGDLRRKLDHRCTIQLSSVLRVWWPEISYDLLFPGSHAPFALQPVTYDSARHRHSVEPCPRCGNWTRFDVCVAGKHLLCGDACHERIVHCSVCHDSACATHGGPCATCGQPVCQHDREHCAYGTHLAYSYHCPSCLIQSFERRPLCVTCAEKCPRCERDFPHELMAPCRVCTERICAGHNADPDGSVCTECGAVACRTHGMHTARDAWVCIDHASTGTCCTRVFGRSQLQECCVDRRERLCPEHNQTCAGCRGAVCETHRSPLFGRKHMVVCDSCRHSCELCGPERAYLASDLQTCAVCETTLYCSSHGSELPACAGCGRRSCGANGCSPAALECSGCGMSYCHHCLDNGTCSACRSMQQVPVEGSWLQALSNLPKLLEQSYAEVLAPMLRSPKQLTLSAGTNRSYRVLVLDYTPRWFEVWRSGRRLRIILDQQGTPVRVKVETEAS